MLKCLCAMSKKVSTSNAHRFQLALQTLMILKKKKKQSPNKTQPPHNPIHITEFLKMPT